jgi:hypothetical protein
MHTRRRYLAAMGLGLAGLAGCLSEDEPPGSTGTDDSSTTDGGTDDSSATDGGTDDSPTTDGGTTERPGSTDDATPEDTPVTVRDPVVRKRVTHYSWPGSTGVLAPEDEQFVVASVTGPEDAVPPEFAFEVGSETFSPGVDVAGRHGATFAGRTDGSVLENEHASGYLAFRVPTPLDGADARIVRDDGADATPLPDDELTTLGRPAAEFELDALDLPDAVEHPERVDVSLSVTNVADVDGRFLAGVHWPTEGIADDDETTVLERDVAAGETTSFSLSLATGHAVNETSDHPLTVQGSVSAGRSVEVTVDETTTGSVLESCPTSRQDGRRWTRTIGESPS